MEFKLTKQEKLVIKRLKNLAKIWPKSLWLFSGSGTLCVMRANKKGNPIMESDDYKGAVDERYVIDEIDIPNDGGDW